MEWLEGVVCTTPIFHAKVLQREAPEPATSSQQHKYPKSRHCDDGEVLRLVSTARRTDLQFSATSAAFMHSLATPKYMQAGNS